MKITFSFLFTILIFSGCTQKPGVNDINHAKIEPIRSIRIAISGDAMHHLPQINAARHNGDTLNYDYLFSSISKVWKSADFAVVNLETTLAPNPPYYGYPCFRSPIEFLTALKKAGVTTIALANNHCVDMSASGVRHTIKALSQHNLAGVGLSADTTRNVIAWLKKDNISVALLNYTYGTNGLPIPKGMQANLIDTTLMRQDCNRARAEGADFVIPLLHWGYEYHTTEHREQQQLALWCRSLGMDYIIGSHPHVVQPVDTHSRVVYSLGNLVSAQYMPYTQGGITIILELFSNNTISAKFIPHWVDIQNRYQIFMPWDTINVRNEQFAKSLDETRKIVTRQTKRNGQR